MDEKNHSVYCPKKKCDKKKVKMLNSNNFLKILGQKCHLRRYTHLGSSYLLSRYTTSIPKKMN